MRQAVLAILLSSSITVAHGGQVFDNIADNTGAFAGLVAVAPSVNASGVVGFVAALDAGGSGVFTATTASPVNAATTIADNGGPIASFAGPAINATGTVAFFAQLDSGVRTIQAGSGGPLTTLIDDTGPFLVFSSPSFNDGGWVAFNGLLDDGTRGIYASSGGPVTTIADDGGVFSSFGGVALNDAGLTAFLADLDAGGEGVYSGNGAAPAVVADTSGPFDQFSRVALSSGGTVGFVATLDDGRRGVYTNDGGVITTVADTGGPFSFIGALAVNDRSTVFGANIGPSGVGLYTGPDPDRDRIIRYGDALFGSTVTDLVINDRSLSDNDILAFGYRLSDGRQGIATTVIPEPSVLVLLAIATVLVSVSARRPPRMTPPLAQLDQG